MTFRDYIGAITGTKIFIGGQEQFVIDLFKSAKAHNDVDKNTAKSWLKPEDSKGYRNCRIRDYFPEDTIDETGFIKFISSRTNTSWPKLQEAFHSISKDCIVNLATNDTEIFYWSILNQFQKIHRLPLSEMPAKKMVILFKNAVESGGISAFLGDHVNFSYGADLSGMIEAFLKSLHA